MKKMTYLLIALLSFSCTTHQSTPQKITFYNQEYLSHKQRGVFEISEKMEFWKEQRRGANGLLNNYRPDYFNEAKNAGIQYLRFGPNLLPADEKDFLIGDLDNFTDINQTDLALLIKILDQAYKNDVRIILTMFELPGHRYGNPNEVDTDCRLWQDEKYWLQAFKFWKQLAASFKDHPAIVAYNPINEPVAAYAYGYEDPSRKFEKWLDRTKGTTADLNLFNKLMVESIREVDLYTPIVLDGYFWTDPRGLPYMEPINDPNILYAFHNPAPWCFSALQGNKGRYSYPNSMPKYWNGPVESWTINDLENLLDPVVQFIEENEIQEFQIIASEFWCHRRVNGCKEYFQDLITLYNRNNWHWGFWQFRGDGGYTGFDYELGNIPNSGRYIVRTKRKDVDPESLKQRFDNPIWRVLSAGLKGDSISLSFDETTPVSEEEISGLISALYDEEWLIRETAAMDLAKLGRDACSAIPHLLLLLEDEEWLVRRSSIYALSKIGSSEDNEIWNKIRKLQNDPEEHVRIEASLALAIIEDR